jgi:hypothetical protein
MKSKKFKMVVKVFNMGKVNEFRLSRLAAERLYFADCRNQGIRIAVPLPTNTKGKTEFTLSNGAILKREANGGPRPFALFGQGAQELLKAQSLI